MNENHKPDVYVMLAELNSSVKTLIEKMKAVEDFTRTFSVTQEKVYQQEKILEGHTGDIKSLSKDVSLAKGLGVAAGVVSGLLANTFHK